MTFNTKILQQTVDGILHAVKKRGASAAEVHAGYEKGFSVSARMDAVDNVEYHSDQSVSLTMYLGHQRASVSTSDLSPLSVNNLIDKAFTIGQYIETDPYAGLADSALMASNYPDLDLYHHWDITPEQAIKIAIECEQYARTQSSEIIHTEECSISTSDSYNLYANSHGFLGDYFSSEHTLFCGVVAKRQNEKQESYEYTCSRNYKQLLSSRSIAEQVANKVIRRLGAQKLTTRRCPVLFHAPVAKSLIGHFISAIRGGNLYRQNSFLIDSLGKQIFPENISIYQDPLEPGRLGSTPFDDEGARTVKHTYVDQGYLSSYALDSYSARRLNLKSTGNRGGVFNLYIFPATQDFDGLLKEMQTGLLVTELMGQGVNLLTGNYSRGAFGYWVENGTIQYPVNEITIAGTLQDIFNNIVAIGNDIDQRGNINTGSILISAMTVAGE